MNNKPIPIAYRLLRQVRSGWSDLLESNERLSQRTDQWLQTRRPADRVGPTPPGFS
jgi:hypothetical protein